MNPFEIKKTSKSVKRGKNLSFEEIYLDAQTEEFETLEVEKENINYRVLVAVLLVGFLVLAGRIYSLQVIKGSKYRALAEGNKLRVEYLLAPRGLILDKNGSVLVSNIPSFELVAIGADLPKDASLQNEVSLITSSLKVNRSDLLQKINAVDRSQFEAQTIAENLPKDQALILISKQGQLKGFFVQNSPIRQYKDSLSFAHVLGFVGKISKEELDQNKDKGYLLNDYIGKSGIEAQYENYLRGTAGKRQNEVDAQGNFRQSLAEIPAIPGNNIRLNIDTDLQRKIYDSLVAILKQGAAKKAAAIASNPKTGQILALVNLPSFDNNLFAQGISASDFNKLINDPTAPLLNRAISGQYPPGSTVKPMLAIAGLTEGVITPATQILDNGAIRVGSFIFYGYRREGLGIMDVYSAIARSSDIYFYTVGGGNAATGFKGLGPDKIASWYKKFYLGQTLGIDLPGEKAGLVPAPAWKQKVKNEKWFLGDTYHMSIGQGDVLVTPLQMNSWTSTLANGGKIMRPYVVDQVEDLKGKMIFKDQPRILAENFLDPQYVKIVADGMRQTITAGTAQSLKTFPIEVSGKTGTAQFDAKNLARTHAWFTSYAPSNDPQIVLTVLVESGGEGSSVAVPVAKEVYTWWAKNRLNK